MADLKLTVDVTDLTKLIKTTDQTKTAINALGRSFARSNDTSAYMRGINQIVASQSKLERSARLSRSEIMQMGAAARQQALYLQELNRVTSQAGIGMNRYGVLTQQAGYQIGDFIVQVQSGTNAFVAFGQQATQVAGTLTLLGGSWVMMGTVLGIIIPLVTALGAAWMRTNGQGRTLEQTVSDLTSATDAFRDSLDNVMSQDLETTFGNFTDAVRSLEEGFVDLNSAAALRNFNETLANLRGQANAGFFGNLAERATGTLTDISLAPILGTTGLLYNYGDADERAYQQLGFDMARGTYVSFTEELQRLAAQGDMEGVLDEFNRFFEDATDGTDDVTNAGYLLMLQMRQALLAVAEMSAEMNGSAEAARQAREEAERLRQQEEEAARNAERLRQQQEREQERREQMVASLQEEIALQQEILRYGEDSLQVATLRATQEGIAAGFRGQELQDYIDLTLQLREVEQQADENLRILREITGVDTTPVVNQILNIADALGLSTEAAIALRQSLSNLDDGGVSGPDAAVQDTRETFGLQGDIVLRRTYRARSNSSGGGSSEDFVERLQREMALRQRILGLTSDQSDLEREIDRITQGLGAARSQYSEEFITNLARQNLALQEQERIAESLAQTQENLANKISSTFGEAMMSIAEGTKSTEEAFRDMARAIISELYRVLVVQQIVNQVQSAIGGSSGFGSFLGSMLGGGKASGGSVMAGQAYLVGERGPEIIVPGRSGTVMNSNLTQKAMGGQQEVSVRVFVDETGNFDAKVEQISARTVQRAAPQIVEASKKSMIEGVQRGGSIARVFR